MSRTVGLRRGALLILMVMLLLAGCSRSPEAKKARHLERGDRYFQQEKYREAVLEYRNVLRIDTGNAQAIRQLGLAHYQLGEMGHAGRYLLRTQELEPENLEARLKLGSLYLLGGRPEEAAREAEFVLERDQKSLDALALLAGGAKTPEQVEAAVRRLESTRAVLSERARFHLALGGLYLQKGDSAAAERAFLEAAAREPKSAEPHLALASLYVSRRDTSRAEIEYKLAAQIAPVGSPARVRLADFYVLLGRRDEARSTLKEITDAAPDYLPAWRRLGELAFVERNFEEAGRAAAVVLKKNPSDLDARFLTGRIHLAKRETTLALEDFRKVLSVEPSSAPARHQLALAHLQAGNIQQARLELRETKRLAPSFLEVSLLLSQLDIQSGAVRPAIDDLERLIARRPDALAAYALLVTGHLAARDSVRAATTARALTKAAPREPRGPYLLGVALLAQGNRAEARDQFARALSLSPGFVEPLSQLVSLDLAARQSDVALVRVRKQVGIVPESAAHQMLLSQVLIARNESRAAEAALLKAAELDPRLTGPYLGLGQLYAQTGRHEEALAKLTEALRINPQDLGLVMASGIIYELTGDIPKAREAYEKVLAINPRFAPAANNLAWLHSEHGGERGKALALAQTAKDVAPDDPRISDTLGWILYRSGVYQRALSLLQESAAKLPDNPQVQYHLGMAYAQAGNRVSARKALTAAVDSPVNFQGKEEARKVLLGLQ
jgi:tetratricopeptide (TPR) repeat protein